MPGAPNELRALNRNDNNLQANPITLFLGLAVLVAMVTEVSASTVAAFWPDGVYRYYSSDSSYCAEYDLHKCDRRPWERVLTRSLWACAGGVPWRNLWSCPIPPSEFPRTVLVSSGGCYIVEIDHGYSTGYGSRVVVIVDSAGAEVRSLGLRDFCPTRPVGTEPGPRMFGLDENFYWGSGHYIDDATQQLVLRVVPNCPASASQSDSHEEVRIDLRTGIVLTDLGRPEFNAFIGPDTLWSRTFLIASEHNRPAAVACKDGGFAVVPTFSSDYPETRKALRLIRFSPEGDSLWCRMLDTLRVESPTLIQTNDGGFAIAVTYRDCSAPKWTDDRCPAVAYVVRTGPDGEIRWVYRGHGPWWGTSFHLAEAPDAGIVIAESFTDHLKESGVLVEKVSPSGELQWTRRIRDRAMINPSSMTITPAGEIKITQIQRGSVFFDLFTLSMSGDSISATKMPENIVHRYVEYEDGSHLIEYYKPGEKNTISLRDREDHVLWDVDIASLGGPSIGQFDGNPTKGWLMSGGVTDSVCHKDSDFFCAYISRSGQVGWVWKGSFGGGDMGRAASWMPDGGVMFAGQSGNVLILYKLNTSRPR